MSLGSNIQLARKFYNLTQKEFANLIGKTESSVKKYESDQINIPISVLNDISNVFKITNDVLIGDEDSLRYALLLGYTDVNNQSNDVSDVDYLKTLTLYKMVNNYVNEHGNKIDEKTLNELKNMETKKLSNKSTQKSVFDFVKEINNECSVSEPELLYQTNNLNHALDQLITYANKNTPVDLTERQQDILFDEIIDYIRYKLYSMGK